MTSHRAEEEPTQPFWMAPPSPQETPVGSGVAPRYDDTGRCVWCGRGAMKPLYREWWPWLLAFLFVALILGNLT